MKLTLLILSILYCVTSIAESNPLISDFAGYSSCTECHPQQVDKWNTSQHQKAMQHATKKSVLGNFDKAEFENYDLVTRFYTQNDQFWVKTDGPDGKLHDYQIKYTFGIYPLQQYLIEFSGGRLQALDIAWDARPKNQGGQRWFHLHPNEKITSDDVLHWTGPNLNWNYMCAFCHSTNLQKNYNRKDNTYQTSWSEINVSCEACHGPGRQHIAWANLSIMHSVEADKKYSNSGLINPLNVNNDAQWLIDKDSNKPYLSQARNSHKEIETCARCHSRRSQVSDDQLNESLFNAFRPALLTQDLYYADGQIKDEVYVYGSFIQSKMYQAGVTCSDCHNPHTLKLKSEGEQVCDQCHLPKIYRAKTHHFHENNVSCLGCHMSTKTYMGIDKRHDHSFRIPRPDQSINILSKNTDIPNACNKCHSTKTAQWAEQKLLKWYGKKPIGLQQFSSALFAQQNIMPNAEQRLHKLINNKKQPIISRATALNSLKNYPSLLSYRIINEQLKNKNPMIRRSALEALITFDKRSQVRSAFPHVYDKIRSVRIEAVRLLAATSEGELAIEDKNQLKKVKQEFVDSQLFNAERPESQTNLGSYYLESGNLIKSESAYRQAIKLQNQYIPAYIGLAQLLNKTNRIEEAKETLMSALDIRPSNANLHHALGLNYIRSGNIKLAITELKTATIEAPDNLDFQYTYAIALNSTGNTKHSLDVLTRINKKYPNNTKLIYALVTINRDAKNYQAAIKYAKTLSQIMPENPNIQRLIRDLKVLSKTH